MLTVPEVAQELGLSQTTIRTAIYENRLPAIKMFGRPIISRSDMEDYRQRTRPDGEKPKGRPMGARNRRNEAEDRS